MTTKSQKTHGQWSSPISPQHISKGFSFSDVAWNDQGTLVWRERAQGRGRLIVQPADGQASRKLNTDHTTRGGVGYGGGGFTVDSQFAYFIEGDSKRIYRQDLTSGLPRAVTPDYGAAASPQVSPGGRYLLYVHSYEGEDALAIVDTKGRHWPQRLVTGDDFYMHPRWHPGGSNIAWVSWNHPNMPWDGTSLTLGRVDRNGPGLPHLREKKIIAGGKETSIFQPEFSPEGQYLAYISDKNGWWQLYLYDIQREEHRQLTKEFAEYGKPAWQQEMRTYAFSANGSYIYAIRNQDGKGSLWQIELASGNMSPLETGERYTWFEQIAVSPRDNQIALIASGGQTPHRILTLSPDREPTVLRRSTAEEIPPEFYSPPQHITWQGFDGEDVFGLFYTPREKEETAAGRPPLLVLIHGGPTSQRVADFQPKVQFFTSRGYTILQPNYRGSTGYGRKYRDALHGKWGIYDVKDAVSGARHLAEEGKVNEDKMVIMGSSAGGYTVLKTLVDFPGVFKAGISMYGIANQFTLVADTHKFEEHYSDSLLGPLPQKADLYRERSPLFDAHKIKDAVAIFQGGKDKVVSQDQAEAIVAALKENGVPHEYHLYPEEGHGFRKPETIDHFYRHVEQFLNQHVIFT